MKDEKLFLQEYKSPYDKCHELYNISFTQNDGFEDKQFDRYVERAKNYMYEVMKGVVKINDKIKNYDELIKMDIRSYFMSSIIKQYDGKENSEDKISQINKILEKQDSATRILQKINGNEILSRYKYDLCYENNDFQYYHYIDAFLEFLFVNHYDDFSLYYFIEIETYKACKEYVRIHSIIDYDGIPIEKSNYFKTLPSDPIAAYELYCNIFNRVIFSIENLFTRKMTNVTVETMGHDKYKSLEKELKQQTEIADKRLIEINKKNEEIEKLKSLLKKSGKKIEKSQLVPIEQKQQNEYINTLKRENSKLKGKYNLLLDKYNYLKNDCSEKVLNVEETADLNKVVDLDYDKNYMFVMYENTGLKSQILEKFKNANFIETNRQMKKFDARQIDCVIILTSHVGHDMYYKIKEKCKAKNIPMIHCNNFNIDLIEQLLINKMCY